MRTLCIPFATTFLFLIASCNKDEPTPTIVPATKLDTLTTGWKKVIVDSSETFSDIFFKNNTTGYLAGDKVYNTIIGGLSWTPISDQTYYNLAVTNNDNVFFANGAGLFKSINGTGPISQVKVSSTLISDVFFVDDENGYYVEDSGLFNSTDGGNNWAKLSTTGIRFPGYYPALFFTNKNTGWVSGHDTVYKTNASPLNWAGADIIKKPNILFTSVFATPDNIVYTIAEGGELYKSTQGSSSFSLIHTFEPSGNWGDIHFVDNTTGYVCRGNKIYRTTDAGGTWTVVVTLANGVLVELHFTDANHGWACGDKGTVLIYNN